MIALLAKVFIKDRQNYSDGTVRKKYGTLTGITGIVLNVFLFIGKFIAGSISGAISIMADAFNNLSDAGSSVISLAGFMMADKKPDPDHPFGHGRMEYIFLPPVQYMIHFVNVAHNLEKLNRYHISIYEALSSADYAHILFQNIVSMYIFFHIHHKCL